MLHVDTILNNTYQIKKLLNKGCFGRVWLAEDLILNRKVAIKELIRVGDAQTDDFIKEMQTAAKIEHDNVIKVYQALAEDENIFLVMEYCPSGSVRDLLITSGQMTCGEAVTMAITVCNGLEALHRQKIVHHDIKPENLMIGNDGKIKISDFGIVNTTNGTLHYMAPEKFHDGCDPNDVRADIYAVGITLFEVLAGKRPFNGSRAQLLNDHLYGTPVVPDDVPRWLADIIHKALAKHPDLRFQTVGDFAQALQDKQSPALLQPFMLNASIWNAEAEKKMVRKKWYRARIFLEEALKLYPEFSYAHANLGICFRRMGNNAKAYEHFLKGHKHQTPEAIKTLATLHIEHQDYGQAIATLSEYVYRYPLDFEAQNILAEAFFEAGHYEHSYELICIALAKSKDPAFIINRVIARYLFDGQLMQVKPISSPYLKYNLEVLTENPPSSDNIKCKLLFAPFNHQILPSDLTLVGKNISMKHSSKNQIVTIGRFSSNEIAIDKTMISRRHCVIIRETSQQWLVVDLQSIHGTKIDGKPIQHMRLASGTYEIDVAGITLMLGLN